MAMNDQDLERDLLLQELERRKPAGGNTGITGIGLDPTRPLPEVRGDLNSGLRQMPGQDWGAVSGTYANPADQQRAIAAQEDLKQRTQQLGDAFIDSGYGATDIVRHEPGVYQAAAPPARDTSTWDTDGYSAPKYTATKAGGVLSGFDGTKWSDPNHQTPKYVVGRILQEASGGTGKLKDPAQREAAIARIQEAYPGAQYDGKDKITMPDGGVVDIFGKSSAGEFEAAWMPVTGPGGAPLEGGGAPRAGGVGLTPATGSTFDGIQGLMATDTDFYRRLQEEVQRTLGGPQALERDALLRMLGA